MTSRTELSHVLADFFAANPQIECDSTRLRYLASLNNFQRHLGRTPYLCDLNSAKIAEFIEARRGVVSVETIRSDLARLKPLARWCHEEGLIPGPLRLRSPKSISRTPRALTRAEIRNLWRVASTWPGNIWGVPCNIYFAAFVSLSWATAQRTGTTMKLTRDDIRFRKGWFGRMAGASLRYRGETIKGSSGDTVRRVGRDSALHLQALLDATKSVTPFNPEARKSTGNIYAHWHRIAEAAGVPWALPHTLRKSHATHLTLAGGDARASLGHASDETTVKHYLDPSMVDPMQPSSKLFRLEKPSVGRILKRIFGKKEGK